MTRWEQLEGAANLTISLAYLAIAVLIFVPIVRLHQVRSNKLATATAAIFFSCSLGHFTHFLVPLLPSHRDMLADPMSTWWTAVIHTSTAGVAIYYLSLRRSYGRLLHTAPMFDDLVEKRRLFDLEEFRTVNAARAEAEQERDLAVAFTNSLNDHSQSLIYVKDLEGRFLMVNREYEQSFGVRAADLLGKTFDVVDPTVTQHWRQKDREAHAGVRHQEGFIDRPEGRHYFETTKFPVFDRSGELYAVCGISLDVTDQREATAALEAARDEALAANAALAQSRDEAMAAAAAKSTFLATMSHEIRTPMNAVIGMTDLMLDTDVTDQQLEFLQTVRSSGDALLAVINDILDFAKIESGELQLASTPFNLRDETEGCLDILAAPAAAKGLDLVCYFDDSCPEIVVGDAGRMRQILINLLSNAVKFTASGAVLLTATAAPSADDRLDVTVKVSDTGIGISPDGMSRLFRSFSQVDASATRAPGGTGLGLTISQRLARAMGGDVQVVSTQGEGATFTATFSVGVSAAGATTSPQRADQRFAGLSALVVDDNVTSLRILDLQLSQLGMRCTTAQSPLAALALVDEGLSYDVAVVDLQMPDMTGRELAAALRRRPTTAGSPIILLTGMATRPDTAAGDITVVLPKPVKSAALRNALSNALRNRRDDDLPGRDRPARLVPAANPLHILLAEDNLVNQRVAQLLLDKLGHTVDTVADGRAALDAVTVVPYDVVLMDMQMPVMDGLEATRRIRAELSAEQQPYIIAMTANAMVEDREACAAAGMEDYLAKPVRADELKKLLGRVSASIRHVATNDE